MSRSQGLFCEDKFLYKINPGTNYAGKILLFLFGDGIMPALFLLVVVTASYHFSRLYAFFTSNFVLLLC